MTKKAYKLAIILSVSGIMALSMVSFTGAQTSALTASCSGTVASTTVTWVATSTGGTSPYSYLWSGTNGVSGATSSSVTANYPSGGTISVSVNVSDSATSTATTTSSCSAVVPQPTNTTSTPPVARPFFKQAELVINPAGNFLARGMIVQSISSSSFVGKVWGTTWTVNFAPSAELLLRGGKGVKVDLSQIKVGDEVGVSGRVNSDQPGVVNAKVVRNYSIIALRKEAKEDENESGKQNRGQTGNNSQGSGNNQNIHNQIQKILEQIKELQDKVRGRQN
ncbi:MAG: PKD domain-containing protein [Patescibacteria group bacterium]